MDSHFDKLYKIVEAYEKKRKATESEEETL